MRSSRRSGDPRGGWEARPNTARSNRASALTRPPASCYPIGVTTELDRGMAKSTTLTVCLSPEPSERLGALVESTGRSEADLVAEACAPRPRRHQGVHRPAQPDCGRSGRRPHRAGREASGRDSGQSGCDPGSVRAGSGAAAGRGRAVLRRSADTPIQAGSSAAQPRSVLTIFLNRRT